MTSSEAKWKVAEEFSVGRVCVRIEMSESNPYVHRLFIADGRIALDTMRDMDAIAPEALADFAKAAQAAFDIVAVRRDELNIIECCHRHRRIGVKPFHPKRDD